MSEFDKEAERERLREKYEQDQESRAATQRMSELLLQGATMTNSHCDDCGDPIFRYDGREFCPTCQADGAETGDRAGAEPEAESETAPESADADAAETGATRTPAPESSDAPRGAADGAVRDAAGGGARSATGRDATVRDAPLETARESLSRTLVRYARAAEETDDPRRAQEFLAAAREAAETLAALR